MCHHEAIGIKERVTVCSNIDGITISHHCFQNKVGAVEELKVPYCDRVSDFAELRFSRVEIQPGAGQSRINAVNVFNAACHVLPDIYMASMQKEKVVLQ